MRRARGEGEHLRWGLKTSRAGMRRRWRGCVCVARTLLVLAAAATRRSGRREFFTLMLHAV